MILTFKKILKTKRLNFEHCNKNLKLIKKIYQKKFKMYRKKIKIQFHLKNIKFQRINIHSL